MISNVDSIDIGKYIAAICVIAIHTITNSPINNIGTFIFINGIARLAVPFFFCTTGFFLGEEKLKDWQQVSTYIKKLFKTYIIWSLIYIPLELVQLLGTGTFDIEHLLKYLHEIIVEGTFFHLWYFPAVIFSVAVLHVLLRRFSKIRISIMVTIFYLIGLLGDGYAGVVRFLPNWVGQSMEIYKEIFITTRNGLFFALLFIYLGVVISKYSDTLKKIKTLPPLILSVIFICLEVYLLDKYKLAYDYNMIIGIVPGVFFLFIALLKFKIKFNVNSKKLRFYSLQLYGSHMFFYGILLALMTVFNIDLLRIGLIQFIIVFGLSQAYASFKARRL